MNGDHQFNRKGERRKEVYDPGDPTIILDQKNLIVPHVTRKPRNILEDKTKGSWRNKRQKIMENRFRICYLRGDKYETLKKDFDLSSSTVALWVEELKLPPRQHRHGMTKKLQILLTDDEHARVKKHCKRKNITIGFYIRKMINEYLPNEHS